ncbi:MAG TPA: 30S ribosomal protein S8, partial [Dehalococcoidia bacterium]|nr:30S ribosomal protein S8 [Dehalococcoidia bacterium]
MISDPIADMLTRLRNGLMVRHASVLVPASRTKLALARILKEEGFIADFEVIRGKPAKIIKVTLRYRNKAQSYVTGLERVSRP